MRLLQARQDLATRRLKYEQQPMDDSRNSSCDLGLEFGSSALRKDPEGPHTQRDVNALNWLSTEVQARSWFRVLTFMGSPNVPKTRSGCKMLAGERRTQEIDPSINGNLIYRPIGGEQCRSARR